MWMIVLLLNICLVLPSCVARPLTSHYGNHHVFKMEISIDDSEVHQRQLLKLIDKAVHIFSMFNEAKNENVKSTKAIKGKDLQNSKDDHPDEIENFQSLHGLEYSDTYHRKWKMKKAKENMTFRENRHRRRGLVCDGCILFVSLLNEQFEKKASKAEIASMIVKLCEKFHLEHRRVCEGIVDEFKHEMLTVFARLALNSSEVCGQILGPDCAATYNPLALWNVTIPQRSKPPQLCQQQSSVSHRPLRVLQLSDIHLDLLYENGSNAACGEPLCCRKGDKPVKGTPAGYWGDYRHCDTPLWTLHSLFKHLSTQQFDYIMWTGDLPAHNIWNQQKADQVRLVGMLADMFAQYFPKTPVYWALGNHEGVPVNSFPPSTEAAASMNWLYPVLAEKWSVWLHNSSLSNIEKFAYYDVLAKPGFRIVSLNMNYCNTLNFWLLVDVVDPDHELAWLIRVLLQAEKHGEKVHILGHIPPNQCLPAWSWNYYRIVNRFHDTIAAQFFGHTHRDHFLMFYDDVTFKQPISMAYIGPSVTTFPGQNPAYRVYEIQADFPKSCKAVINHETHILNLTEANRSGKAEWRLEYTAKEAYGLKKMDVSEWNDVVKRMQHNEKLIQQYYRYYYKSHPPDEICEKDCRAALLCEILEARSWDPSLCANITNGHTHYVHALNANRFTC